MEDAISSERALEKFATVQYELLGLFGGSELTNIELLHPIRVQESEQLEELRGRLTEILEVVGGGERGSVALLLQGVVDIMNLGVLSVGGILLHEFPNGKMSPPDETSHLCHGQRPAGEVICQLNRGLLLVSALRFGSLRDQLAKEGELIQ